MSRHRLTDYGEFWMTLTALCYTCGNLFDRLGMKGAKADPWVGAIMKAIPHILLALVFIGLQIDRRQFREERRPIQRGAVVYFLVSGLVSIFLGQASFLTAMKLGGVAIAVPAMQVWTMIAAIIGVLWLKEPFRPQVFLGLLIAITGLATLTWGQQLGKPVSPKWQLGLLYGLATAFLYGISSNCIRRGQTLGFPRFHGMVVAYGSGLIYVVTFMAAAGRLGTFSKTPPHFYWLLLIAGTLAFAATSCMYTALRLSPVSKVVPINACYPALAAILAWCLLGDYLNLVMLLGILLVAAGVTVSQLPTKARGRPA